MFKNLTNKRSFSFLLVFAPLIIISTNANAYIIDFSIQFVGPFQSWQDPIAAEAAFDPGNSIQVADLAAITQQPAVVTNYQFDDNLTATGPDGATVVDSQMLSWGDTLASSLQFTGADQQATDYLGVPMQLGKFTFTNGVTSLGTELSSTKFTIDVNIYNDAGCQVGSDYSGCSLFDTRTVTNDLGEQAFYDMFILTTINDAGSAEGDADAICMPGFNVVDDTTNISEPSSTLCGWGIEDPLAPVTFNVTGVLGSLFITDINPTNSNGFVTKNYLDGSVVLVRVPEPQTLLLMSLGLLLLGYNLKRKTS
jgi:hypothetical protein